MKRGLSQINKRQIKIKILVNKQKLIEIPPNWNFKLKFKRPKIVLHIKRFVELSLEIKVKSINISNIIKIERISTNFFKATKVRLFIEEDIQ